MGSSKPAKFKSYDKAFGWGNTRQGGGIRVTREFDSKHSTRQLDTCTRAVGSYLKKTKGPKNRGSKKKKGPKSPMYPGKGPRPMTGEEAIRIFRERHWRWLIGKDVRPGPSQILATIRADFPEYMEEARRIYRAQMSTWAGIVQKEGRGFQRG